jgi:antagonist of KipI
MSLRVVDAGLFTTVQDLGRPGFREWGVPIGGAFDRASAAIANALLGNPPECAVIELTLSGAVFRAEKSLAIALAGAPAAAMILSSSAPDRDLPIPGCTTLRAHEQLVISRMSRGARLYLAVRGGWQTPMQFGSRSTEVRLSAGASLPALTSTVPTRFLRESLWSEPPSAVEAFRIVDGPDAGLLGDSAERESFWLSRTFRVGSNSNRMGLRLEGEPIPVTSPPDRLSTPVSPGAIQLAGGSLIVLGVACGTMGGYPHVGHVASADLDRLGQLRPGDAIRFRRISLGEAREADRLHRESLRLRRLQIEVGAQNLDGAG